MKTITPYIFFGGNCEAALDHYKNVLGAEVTMVMHYNQSPDPVPEGMLAEGFENKVMHASFKIGESDLMGSDGCKPGDLVKGLTLSYLASTKEEADKVFAGLAEGGEVTMPLDKTFWSPYFGMLEDKFGIGWMVTMEGEPA